MKYYSNRGFTLVELIVVTIIIGMLTSIGVVSYRYVIDQSRTSTATSNLNDIVGAIESARTKSGKTLMEITENQCSFCQACDAGRDLRDMPDDQTCVERWNNISASISRESGIDITKIKRDPWGSPYVVDENDGETHPSRTGVCYDDWIMSVGPDGVMSTSDDIRVSLKPVSRGCE